MNASTVEALLALNAAFYEQFAGDFARTRKTWPPGFDRILPYVQSAGNVIDLGCGNGRLLRYLGARDWRGRYLGLDSSEGLLAEAHRTAAESPGIEAKFIRTDLTRTAWTADIGSLPEGSVLASLAVLHHIPGRRNRIAFLAACEGLMSPQARLLLSTWQFITSARLRKRVLSWETAGMDEQDLESGDYLIAWGQGAAGRRYCAAIDEHELLTLAFEAQLTPIEIFTGDGFEGDLNLYGIFSAR